MICWTKGEKSVSSLYQYVNMRVIMKYQLFVINANKAMFTLQYVVLGPDEKDVNKFFFILEEEQ